jgi:aspartyl-tRNA(Asn)/glutamyl-tRNA(Gln) amidotransferase subunit B
MRFEETRNTNPKNLIPGATGDWEVVIGMEVHAQVASEAKLFSGAPTAFGGEPNGQVSLVDAAMPGMLPVINEGCVRQAIRTGLGLKAKINRHSVFARKNYFYPDLPQGYQISQYDQPLVGEGTVVMEIGADGSGALEEVRIGIERLHIEQDAGKSLHDQHATKSLVDLNRSGVALMEIVSKPDIRSAEEARAFVAKLRTILRYLGTSDADMEKGNLRADINVSVRRPGEKLGTRCEIKNVNSMRFAGQAIEHEARRQIGVLEDGGAIEQETRLFDPGRGETRSMRAKEEAHDYRYFPDPDLLPLEFDDAYVEALAKHLPELPDEKRARFQKEYGMNVQNAAVLCSDRDAAEFFESVVHLLNDKFQTIGKPRVAAQVGFFVTGEVFAALNRENRSIRESPVTPEQISALLRMTFERVISQSAAKDVLKVLWAEGGDPRAIVEARGLTQVTDAAAIEGIVDSVIAANAEKAAEVKGKPALVGWFVGQVMKASGGKANPQAVNALLKAKLGIE